MPKGILSLSDLRELDLAFNNLVEFAFPSNFGAMDSLVVLSVEGNTGLLSVPLPKNLRILNVSNTAFGKSLHAGDFPLPSQLQELYAHSLELPLFPPSTLSLNNLSVLNIANNKITAIPPDIARFAPTLHVLDISSNPIATIDPNIGALVNLTHLNLSSLPPTFTALPPALANLSALQKLDIHSSTGLELLDIDFSRMSKLVEYNARASRLNAVTTLCSRGISLLNT